MTPSEYRKIKSLFDKEFAYMNSENLMGDKNDCILTLSYPDGSKCIFAWGKAKADILKDFIDNGNLDEAHDG